MKTESYYALVNNNRVPLSKNLQEAAKMIQGYDWGNVEYVYLIKENRIVQIFNNRTGEWS